MPWRRSFLSLRGNPVVGTLNLNNYVQVTNVMSMLCKPIRSEKMSFVKQ